MFCTHCGTQTPDGASFCTNCGARVSVNTEIVTAPYRGLEIERYTTEEIKEFLGHAKTLEISKDTLCRTWAQLQHMINNLGIERRKEKPKSEASEGFAHFWLFFWIFFLAGLAFCVLLSGDPESSAFDRIASNLVSILTVVLLFFNLELLKNVGIALGVAVGSSFILCLICVIYKYIVYRLEIKDYRKGVEVDQKRVQHELRQADALRKQQEAIDADIHSLDAALKRLYSLNVIGPKYQGLIPVVTILEYFEYKRCFQLGGATGAYNLYESEIRQDIIINKLDRVINMLDNIQKNQYALYCAIKESNNYLSQMCQQASDMLASNKVIEQNTAIAAYHTKVTAENTAVSAYIDFCRM